MMLKTTLLIVYTAVLSSICQGQQDPIFDPIDLGQSSATVLRHLEGRVQSVDKFTPDAISFPLAKAQEAHWKVNGYTSDSGTLSKVVFVFADDRLVFIQGKKGALQQLDEHPDFTYDSYEDYRFYKEINLVVHAAEDAVWKLDEEGFHLNLFAWNHPFLENEPWPQYSQEVRIPYFLEMGSSLDSLEPLLEDVSKLIYREKLDGSDPNASLQLNCYGVEYGGFSRKVEARFGSGKLNTVWILTGKEEEARLRKSLVQTFGPAIFVSGDWEAFKNWQVFLRKDKPEVLFLTPALGLYYKEQYFGQ